MQNPTNKEIAKYILEWIEDFDGDGLIITDIETIKNQLEDSSFFSLRLIMGQEQ